MRVRISLFVAMLFVPAVAVNAASYVSPGDGGWECVKPVPCTDQWVAAHFIDSNTGWILGSNFNVLKTTDGGKHWAPQSRRIEEKAAYDIFFADKRHGWMVGCGYNSAEDKGGIILKTDDGGATWRSVFNRKTDGFRAMSFVSSKVGWVVGGLPSSKGVILKTIDGGETWSEQDVGSPVEQGSARIFEGVSFVDENTGWVIGSERCIYKTIDGGKSWKKDKPPGKGHLQAVQFLDASTGWVLSHGMLCTTDGGQTWTEYKLGRYNHNFSFRFSDAKNGIVVSIGETLRTRDGGKTWSAVGGLRYGDFMPAVCTTDANNGWLVGNHIIYHTSDGGLSWQPTSTPGDLLSNLSFIDNKLGWAVGYTGAGADARCLVLKTKDGGDTWERNVLPRKGGLRQVFFIDETHGWAVAPDGNMLRTCDGGVSWDEHATGTACRFSGLQFLDTMTGYAAGDQGTAVKTTDGGKTWTKLATGTMADLFSLHFAGKDTGWVAGADGRLMKTTDGGKTWKRQPSGLGSDLGGLWFANERVGWASDIKGNIIATADGGETWKRQDSGTDKQLAMMRFVDEKAGWAGSQPIIHTDDGGRTWTGQDYGSFLLWDMCFTDKDHGWVASFAGVLRTTTAGLPGAVWAKKQPDGAAANFGHLVITKKSQGYLLAEHPDSRIGIHIKTSDDKPNIGDYIYVHGKIATENNEKIIAADSIDIMCAGWGVLPEKK